MSDQDVEIKIEGFKASNDLLTYLNAELEKIKALSPSNSSIRLSVTSDGQNDYTGQLLVNSSVFNTISSKSDNSLVDLVINLIDGVNRKLSRWKCLRFLT